MFINNNSYVKTKRINILWKRKLTKNFITNLVRLNGEECEAQDNNKIYLRLYSRYTCQNEDYSFVIYRKIIFQSDIIYPILPFHKIVRMMFIIKSYSCEKKFQISISIFEIASYDKVDM